MISIITVPSTLSAYSNFLLQHATSVITILRFDGRWAGGNGNKNQQIYAGCIAASMGRAFSHICLLVHAPKGK